MSPQQIRHQAAVAFRSRCRSIFVNPSVKPLRPAENDETPLSYSEIIFGINSGLIRSPKFMDRK